MSVATDITRPIVRIATPEDRGAIYRLRHDVFARELRQYDLNEDGILRDRLDDHNVYVIIKRGETLAAITSITPPGPHGYSVDKYIQREDMPFPVNDRTYEVRLFTVRDEFRGSGDVTLLMYAAYEWVRARNGERVIALGREEVLPLYERSGFKRFPHVVQSGSVTYHLISALMTDLDELAAERARSLEAARSSVRWEIS